MEENQRTLEFAARFASEKGIARYTRFLDSVQVAAAKQIAREHGAAFSVWGGYEQAERQIGCFLPWGEEASSSDFPLVCLHSRFSSKFCSLSHRDLLGAFMALGLTRDSIGDIIIVDSDIYLFVMAQTADFIMQGDAGFERPLGVIDCGKEFEMAVAGAVARRVEFEIERAGNQPLEAELA